MVGASNAETELAAVLGDNNNDFETVVLSANDRPEVQILSGNDHAVTGCALFSFSR